MSKIEGYSIQNGKPTPDNPTKIESLDIKDIKFIDGMVKEYNTFGDLDNPDYENTDGIYKKIENILAKRKQDKARIQELEAKLEFKQWGDLDNIDFEEYMKNFISKEKVKESYLKMEKEYARKVYDDNYNRNEVKKEEFYKRQVYEELLGESK